MLPPFLDRSARLDKCHPTLESFMADNEARIQHFRTIVVSACRFLKGFTNENSISQYMGLPPREQGAHSTSFKWWGMSTQMSSAIWWCGGGAGRAHPVRCNTRQGRLWDKRSGEVAPFPSAQGVRVLFQRYHQDLQRWPSPPPPPVVKHVYNGMSKSAEGVVKRGGG